MKLSCSSGSYWKKKTLINAPNPFQIHYEPNILTEKSSTACHHLSPVLSLRMTFLGQWNLSISKCWSCPHVEFLAAWFSQTPGVQNWVDSLRSWLTSIIPWHNTSSSLFDFPSPLFHASLCIEILILCVSFQSSFHTLP